MVVKVSGSFSWFLVRFMGRGNLGGIDRRDVKSVLVIRGRNEWESFSSLSQHNFSKYEENHLDLNISTSFCKIPSITLKCSNIFFFEV